MRQAELDGKQRVCKQNFEAMDLVLGIECYKTIHLTTKCRYASAMKRFIESVVSEDHQERREKGKVERTRSSLRNPIRTH